MGRKRASRKSKTIGFKAFQDTDADLLMWWDGVPEGERSQILRDLIRAALSEQGSSLRSNGHGINGNGHELAQVSEDTAWIRSALSDLPSYLERLVTQVAITRPVIQHGPPEVLSGDSPKLEQDAIDRRKAKMRQNTW